MISHLHTETYPDSIFPTPQIETEIQETRIAFERRQWALEQIGFTGMSAWNGSMHEFVNRSHRPHARRH